MARGIHSTLDFGLAYPSVVQGVYYLLIGLWPWLSINTFQWVTGEKTDLWLVQTVGLLLTVIGVALCVATYRREGSGALYCLALGSAAGLALSNVLFVSQRRIPVIYLLDAIVELGLLALWVYSWGTHRNQLGVCEPGHSSIPPVSPPLQSAGYQPAPPASYVQGYPGTLPPYPPGPVPGSYPVAYPQPGTCPANGPQPEAPHT
jgi:hypothetical protein